MGEKQEWFGHHGGSLNLTRVNVLRGVFVTPSTLKPTGLGAADIILAIWVKSSNIKKYMKKKGKICEVPTGVIRKL